MASADGGGELSASELRQQVGELQQSVERLELRTQVQQLQQNGVADDAAASELWLSGSVRKDGARDLLSGMISGFFCKILEHGRVAKQGWYGRPSGVYQLAEAGRGWPSLTMPARCWPV